MSAAEFAYRVSAAARRPANWWQLLKFGVVGGSGYLINLAVFALLSGNLGIHHMAAAIGAFCVAVYQQLLLEPPLDLRRRRRPRGLPGGPLLRGQRRRSADQPRRCCEALVGGTSLGELPAQAIAVAVAMPFNFLGNKLWTFA